MSNIYKAFEMLSYLPVKCPPELQKPRNCRMRKFETDPKLILETYDECRLMRGNAQFRKGNDSNHSGYYVNYVQNLLASLCIFAAPASSLWEVEERKLEASVPTSAASKSCLMFLIAPVMLWMVPDAPFAVSMIMSTTVWALDWNLAFSKNQSHHCSANISRSQNILS